MLKLKVFGKFSVVDERGQECSPSGKKARAILILLACSPGQVRSRHWLQDKLWSDRSREQAAGSLRTCLSEIRKAFGQQNHVLQSDRINIGLDKHFFELDYETTSTNGSLPQPIEAFEDVDIRDREFEHTIRDLRLSLKASYSAKTVVDNCTSPIVDLIVLARGGLLSEVVGEVIVNRITSTLNLVNGISTIVRREETLPVKRPFTTCRLKVLEVDGEVYVSSRVLRGSDGSEIWSSDIALSGLPSEIADSLELSRLSLRTIDKISDALIHHDENLGLGASAVYSLEVQAIQHLFSLDKESLKESDRIFAMAYERSPQGHYLAWRAFLRNLAFFQHQTTDFLPDNRNSTLELSYEAVRESPDHPLVLSIASQLDYIHQGDLGTSLAIANKAIQSNVGSPLCWAFYSNALVANKRHKEAMNAAKRAISLAKGSRYEFFFHHFACMAAVSQCDYHSSMRHAQTALRFRPDFVSTRRYELAIATELSDQLSFEHSLEMMKQHEKGFQTYMLLEKDYPVTTMRRLPLIESVNDYLCK